MKLENQYRMIDNCITELIEKEIKNHVQVIDNFDRNLSKVYGY